MSPYSSFLSNAGGQYCMHITYETDKDTYVEIALHNIKFNLAQTLAAAADIPKTNFNLVKMQMIRNCLRTMFVVCNLCCIFLLLRKSVSVKILCELIGDETTEPFGTYGTHCQHRDSGCTYLCEIKCFREHNDRADILLPHHAPKIVNGFFGWTLCYYVSVWFQKTLCGRQKEYEIRAIEFHVKKVLVHGRWVLLTST